MLSKTICVLLVVLTATITAFPCRCVPASLKTYYRRADAVVTAKVLSVSTSDEGEKLTTARLEVLNAWKKGVPNEIEVITGTTCIYDFRVSETHLLYLLNAPENRFSTMRCQGSLPLDKAQKPLNWLKRYGKKTGNPVSSLLLPGDFDERPVDRLFETVGFFEDTEFIGPFDLCF